jgi:hypothetical protein
MKNPFGFSETTRPSMTTPVQSEVRAEFPIAEDPRGLKSAAR